jgi:hypothetical protein
MSTFTGLGTLCAPVLATGAGLLVLASMVPEVRRNFADPTRARGQDWRRPALQAAGNACWHVYGFLVVDPYISVVTGIGVALSLVLFVQARTANRV